MERVFLSYSFDEADREPARWVRTLLESNGVRAVTGEALGGGNLTDEVRKRIESSDGFVGLWTRRESLDGNPDRFRTSNWLIDEAAHARAVRKPTILLVEKGVDTAGMGASNERIQLDRDAPHESLLRVAQTLSVWREEYGRVVTVRLTPEGIRIDVIVEAIRKALSPGSA